jgi:phospholipid/cholesterol/gamma-HCH transport system substrate-binding protein
VARQDVSIGGRRSQRSFVLKRLNTELFVGLFMVIGFICFAVVAVHFGGQSFFGEDGYELKATFSSVAGLKEGAPVEMAGVPVGRVTEIRLKKGKALLTVWIKSELQVEDDAMASVRTKGLIGEKYLKLSSGASSDLLSHGDELTETESVVDIEDLVGKFIYGK